MSHILKNNLHKVVIFIIAIFICLLIFHIYKITPQKICDLSNLMDGCLTFSSIATALLFGSFSLIFAKSQSRFNKNMTAMGIDLNLVDILLLASFIFFTISVLSIIGLIIDSFIDDIPNIIFQLFASLWIITVICGILNVFYMFWRISGMIKIMYKYRYGK